MKIYKYDLLELKFVDYTLITNQFNDEIIIKGPRNHCSPIVQEDDHYRELVTESEIRDALKELFEKKKANREDSGENEHSN